MPTITLLYHDDEPDGRSWTSARAVVAELTDLAETHAQLAAGVQVLDTERFTLSMGFENYGDGDAMRVAASKQLPAFEVSHAIDLRQRLGSSTPLWSLFIDEDDYDSLDDFIAAAD